MLVQYLIILITAIVANNTILLSGSALEVSLANTNNLKNSFIYSLIILIISLVSALLTYLADYVLNIFALQKYVILSVLIISAIIVQITEYVCKKILPLFVTNINFFIPILACSNIVIQYSLLGTNMNIINIVLTILSSFATLFVVLCIIGGIRKNTIVNNASKNYCDTTNTFLIILFILVFCMAF